MLTFGISGYLYRNAVLYYDSETETFWSQMTGKAVVGPLTGKSLRWMPSEVTSWKQWRRKHPETTVLKPPLGMNSYLQTNRWYDGYRSNDRPMFPTSGNLIPTTYPKKTPCTILVRGDDARCYPHPALKEGENRDGDLRIVKEGVSVRVLDGDGKELTTMHGYWFAFHEFYEGGTVWTRK